MPEPYLLIARENATIRDMSNVAHYRKLRGLKQNELADLAGVSQPHISRIERGDEGVPVKLYRELAAALGVSMSDLFADEMTKAETELVAAFRTLPENIRQGWLAMARAAAAQPDPEGQ